MLRSNLLGLCLWTAACFAACGGSDDDGGDGGGAGEATGGTGGDAGAPSGGTAGGKATGGTASGGTATGGRGGTAGTATEGGAGSGGEGGIGGPAGAGGEGGASCVPTEPADEVCDDVDNDCSGIADDIDVGNDGIFDCLRIVLIGAPGAFASSNFEGWLEEQGTNVSRIHATGTPAALASEDLNGFDIAILDGLLRGYLPGESQVLSAWVRAGGGLMSLNGHTGGNDLAWGNSLLADLGVEHVPGLISANITTFHSHPLTTGLTSVLFNGGYHVGNLSGGAGSVVVAEDATGPVGLAFERGGGRGYVWGDEWVEFDSQWTSLPEIETFWINALGWLSHAR